MYTILKRSKGVVVSEPVTKKYKFVFKNRRLMDNFDSPHMAIIRVFIYTEVYVSRCIFIRVSIYTDIY